MRDAHHRPSTRLVSPWYGTVLSAAVPRSQPPVVIWRPPLPTWYAIILHSGHEVRDIPCGYIFYTDSAQLVEGTW